MSIDEVVSFWFSRGWFGKVEEKKSRLWDRKIGTKKKNFFIYRERTSLRNGMTYEWTLILGFHEWILMSHCVEKSNKSQLINFECFACFLPPTKSFIQIESQLQKTRNDAKTATKNLSSYWSHTLKMLSFFSFFFSRSPFCQLTNHKICPTNSMHGFV